MEEKHKTKNIAKKGAGGITLIALVVTIIVLLILAGISIMMLTGNNGILTKAGASKEMTEMAQLKEQAELVKSAMLIDKTVNGTEELTRKELVDGIAEDKGFSGSQKSGNKVITADEKYDVKVGSDLSITVTKHVVTAGKEIILTLTEEETESRAALLKVTASIDGVEEPTPEELEKKLDPEGTGNTEELKDMFLKAVNILMQKYYGGGTYSSWNELVNSMNQETQTPSSVFEITKSMLPYYGYTSTEMYQWMIETEAYKPDIILTCSNGEKITVKESGEFVITKNDIYTVTASDEDGDYGEDSKKITKCDVEVYSDLQTATTIVETKDGKNVPVPAGFAYGNDNKVGKFSTGFVITDSVDTSTHYSTGNEFVWIPVDKDTLKVVGTNGVTTDKIIAKESTGDRAGTDSKGNTNYEGVLYEFSGTGNETSSSETPRYKQLQNGGVLIGYGEPYLTEHDNDTSKPDGSEQTYLEQIGLNAETFEKEIIESYNAMIKSIQTYGGFYIARYEMGVEDNKVTSKLGGTPTTANNRYHYVLVWVI